MEVEIGFDESITDAANRYYSDSKKMNRKIAGVKVAIKNTEEKIKKQEKIKLERVVAKKTRKKEWFEKYRFSFTQNGKLILAGKDATSNEIIVKRYLEKEDLHFHSNIQGSAHVILKDGQNADKIELGECAKIASIYSRAWKDKLLNVDVYFVKPEQVTKTPQTGEYLSTGSFVIRGEREWIKKQNLDFYVGLYTYENKPLIMCGTKKVFEKNKSPYFIKLGPGRKKKSDIANLFIKEIKKIGYNEFKVEDLLHILPSGELEVKA